MKLARILISVLTLGIAVIPSTVVAADKKLEALNIHTVYMYSSLVRRDDTPGQEQAAWVKQALADIVGWKVANTETGADAVVMLVPHGQDYPQSSRVATTSCTSNEAGLTCKSSDGSSLIVNCIGASCWSHSYTGDYDSLVIALPVGNPASRNVKTVWDSDKAAVSGWFGRFDEATGSTRTGSTFESVVTLCRATGNGSLYGCERRIQHSWSRFQKAGRSNEIITLPK